MHAIFSRLSASAHVLDLGSGPGSFDAAAYGFRTVRADAESAAGLTVQADAAALPFAPASFDAVVSNHSLEHFLKLDEALAEVGRVLKPGGALYVAVPDANTFTDRLYRWLAHGTHGHVNAFTSAPDLARRISHVTGLECTGVRTLHTSLSFLNRRNRKTPAPRKLMLLGGGLEPVLVLLTYALRIADRWFGTRASVYGWEFYFGGANAGESAWTNVCVRCGAGHPAAVLKPRFGLYRCPGCGAKNLFTPDPPAVLSTRWTSG